MLNLELQKEPMVAVFVTISELFFLNFETTSFDIVFILIRISFELLLLFEDSTNIIKGHILIKKIFITTLSFPSGTRNKT